MPIRRAATPAERVLPMVGQTPLLDIRLEWRGRPRRIFAKYEALNLTGSIKDRMAAHILLRAYETEAITPGDEIVEASSGNTAISLAAIGRALGHPVRIFMPDWMSEERKKLLRSLGAELVDVSAEEGGFLGAIEMAHAHATEHANAFEPRQFSNEWNVDAHALGTGREILRQLAEVDLSPTAFVAGVGTGGTVMGVARTLRSAVPAATIHPLEPAESPVLETGCKVGNHRIQGISDEFIPSIVHLDELDEIVAVHDGDAIIMAQKLSSQIGLAVGISSGANVVGALHLLEAAEDDAVVVTVLPDSNKKYMSTDLFREEPVREGYLSPDVRFLSYEAIPACECPR